MSKAILKREIQSIEDDIRAAGLAPMWRRPGMRAQPESRCAPQSWEYANIKSLLLDAAPNISTEDCERRVLILENAGLAGSWYLSPTMFAGVQLVLPGEIAGAHRHSQAAMRFVFEGAGAYAAIDGERVSIEPGDLLITPRMAWHDHGHEGEDPALWLDVLDVPLVATLDAEFREWNDNPQQNVTHTPGTSEAEFGAGLLPVSSSPDSGSVRPGYLKRYSYQRSRRAIAHLLRSDQMLDPYHGVKLTYADPVSGKSVLPSISAFLQGLPRGFTTRSSRSTETRLLVLVEGEVTVKCDNQAFNLRPRDMLMVPSWRAFSLESKDESVLFSVSNRPLLEKLELWREELR